MAYTFEEGANKYEALRSLHWYTEGGEEPEPIPAGSEVLVATRGFFCTDGDGRSLEVGDHDLGITMAGLLNHAWETWVEPRLHEMEENEEAIPDVVKKVLLRFHDDGYDLQFNPPGLLGHVKTRPGTELQTGDPVRLNQILDIGPMNPPTWEGRPCAYILVDFKDDQTAVYLDCRPNQDEVPDDWDDESKEWLGRMQGLQLLSKIYGHPAIAIPRLVDYNLTFTIGPKPSKVSKVCKAVVDEKPREEVEAIVEETFDAQDWEDLIETWRTDSAWAKRQEVFDDALRCYKAKGFGGAVTQLMPQVEGIMMDVLMSENLGIRESGRAKKWTTRRNQFEKVMRNRGYGPIRRTMLEGLLHFIENSNLFAEFFWDEPAPESNRHAPLHGKDVGFGNKVNADRMFLVLDALFWLTAPDANEEE